jgi:hypothetical protein
MVIKDKEKNAVYQKKYADANREKRAKWNKDWIEKNRDRYNNAKAEYRFKLKVDVISQYTDGKMCCQICGYDKDIDALCLDHINDDGAEHRKQLGISSRGNSNGTTIYERIKANGLIDGLQVLCFNCNTIKELQRKRGNKTSAEMFEAISKPIRWKDDKNQITK